jgi:UPF0755 protein
VVCLGLAGLGAVAVARAMRPPDLLERGSRTVEIPATIGLLGIARQLAEQGVIRSQSVFVGLTLSRGTARSLKAGEYEVPQGASLLNVLQLLETGRVKPHLLVLPEGFTLRDLARQIEAEGIAPAADVIRIATSPHLAWSPIETDSLEGYLFPDTYQVTKGMRVEEILGRTQRFRDCGHARGGRARPGAWADPPSAHHAGLDRGERKPRCLERPIMPGSS